MQKFGEGFLMACGCIAALFGTVAWVVICFRAIRLLAGQP